MPNADVHFVFYAFVAEFIGDAIPESAFHPDGEAFLVVVESFIELRGRRAFMVCLLRRTQTSDLRFSCQAAAGSIKSIGQELRTGGLCGLFCNHKPLVSPRVAILGGYVN